MVLRVFRVGFLCYCRCVWVVAWVFCVVESGIFLFRLERYWFLKRYSCSTANLRCYHRYDSHLSNLRRRANRSVNCAHGLVKHAQRLVKHTHRFNMCKDLQYTWFIRWTCSGPQWTLTPSQSNLCKFKGRFNDGKIRSLDNILSLELSKLFCAL